MSEITGEILAGDGTDFSFDVPPNAIKNKIEQTVDKPYQIENPFDSVDECANYIKSNRQEVDYTKMVPADSRVVSVGENHANPRAKAEFKASLQELKNLGFTHVGMEMLGTDQQQLIDEYVQTGARKNELLEQLKEFQRYRYANVNYLEIIDEAKRLDLKIVALDMPDNLRDDLKDKGISRDIWMKQTIKTILDSDTNNKIVTFSGRIHMDAWEGSQTMAGLLREDGVSLTSVNLSGGKQTDGIWVVDRAARKAGVDKDRFMLPCQSKLKNTAVRPSFDWIIHSPQYEDQRSHIDRRPRASSTIARRPMHKSYRSKSIYRRVTV